MPNSDVKLNAYRPLLSNTRQNTLLPQTSSRASIDSSDVNDKHVTFAKQQIPPQVFISKNSASSQTSSINHNNNPYPPKTYTIQQNNSNNNFANEFTESSYYLNKYNKKLISTSIEQDNNNYTSMDDNDESQLVIHKYDRSPIASVGDFEFYDKDDNKIQESSGLAASKTAMTLLSVDSIVNSRMNSTNSLVSITTDEVGFNDEEMATTECSKIGKNIDSKTDL